MEGSKWTLGRHILESITCLKQRRESLSEAYVEIISVDIKDTGYSRTLYNPLNTPQFSLPFSQLGVPLTAHLLLLWLAEVKKNIRRSPADVLTLKLHALTRVCIDRRYTRVAGSSDERNMRPGR